MVRKTAGLVEILSCFQSVANGNSWTAEGFRRFLPHGASQASLTRREAEIMERLERGWRNRDIADELGIRIGTVKIHVKHIFEKKGIRGRYGLAVSEPQRKRRAARGARGVRAGSGEGYSATAKCTGGKDRRRYGNAGEELASFQPRHRSHGNTQHSPGSIDLLDRARSEEPFELATELGRAFVANPLGGHASAQAFVDHQHAGFMQPDGLQIPEAAKWMSPL